ncbi:MAG TPA: hypothetical protein VHL53_20805, partial [Acidimicrobiia bacterium]|nr:hypothetical protein [Acidimicrobiia bacterium]
FVHFRVVHGVAGLNPDVEWGEWSGAWTAEFPHPQVGKLVMSATVWGTNAVVNRSVRGGEILAYVASATPMGGAGTRFFMSVATRRGETAEAVLDQQQALHTQIINEDLPIMNTLRLGDDHFVASDRQMVKYLRRVRTFPRVSMAELEAG